MNMKPADGVLDFIPSRFQSLISRDSSMPISISIYPYFMRKDRLNLSPFLCACPLR